MYREKIVDLATGQESIRPYTDKEIAEVEAAQAEAAAKAEAAKIKEAARQALLDKLGITADEAKLLLG